MSLTIAAARADVFAVLSGVAGISGGAAKAYDRFRYIQDEAVLKSIGVGTSGRLHVWMVTLATEGPFLHLNAQNSPGWSGINYSKVLYTFDVLGWYAHKDADASEKAWADQVEAVITAFRLAVQTGTAKLGDPNVGDAGPAQWVEGGHVHLPPRDGGALCHFARVRVPVRGQP
jgi:hypothetical protein